MAEFFWGLGRLVNLSENLFKVKSYRRKIVWLIENLKNKNCERSEKYYRPVCFLITWYSNLKIYGGKFARFYFVFIINFQKAFQLGKLILFNRKLIFFYLRMLKQVFNLKLISSRELCNVLIYHLNDLQTSRTSERLFFFFFSVYFFSEN